MAGIAGADSRSTLIRTESGIRAGADSRSTLIRTESGMGYVLLFRLVERRLRLRGARKIFTGFDSVRFGCHGSSR
eukprot:scaffold247792_cov32-Tisochrysis_lutea.AAC.3